MPHLRDGFIVAKVGIARQGARPLPPSSTPPLPPNDGGEDGAPTILTTSTKNEYHLSMPTGLKRYQTSGHFHAINFSCYDRRPYLATPTARDLFEQSLEKTRRKYDLHVFAYVVMPEHVHLLVSEPQKEPLSKAIQALKLSVSKQSPQSPFWLDRYYDFNITTDKKHVEKLRYIHRNPVARGLVEKPEDWSHSSFRTYLTRTQRTVTITLPAF